MPQCLRQSRPKTPPRIAKTAPTTPRKLVRPLPPPPSAKGLDTINTNQLYLNQLLDGASEILLYRSPSHTGFMMVSYVAGGLLILGAGLQSLILTRKPPELQDVKTPWWVNALTTSIAFAFAVGGTVFILGPFKMIKTITLHAPSIRAKSTKIPMLRVEIKRPLPFIQTRAIEVPASEAFLDRRIAAHDDIEFANIPTSEAKAFVPGSPKSEHLDAASRGWASGAWHFTRREIGRMCQREGFAYLRFQDYGSMKLDLQECEILDYGSPLEKLTLPDPDAGRGLVAIIRRYLGF